MKRKPIIPETEIAPATGYGYPVDVVNDAKPSVHAQVKAMTVVDRQRTFVLLLQDEGYSVTGACEFMGISRETVGRWASLNPAIEEVVDHANEIDTLMRRNWLNDYGNGRLRSAPAPAEIQKFMYCYENKRLLDAEGKITINGEVDNRRYIVNVISGSPEARAALSALNRAVMGAGGVESDSGGRSPQIQPEHLETCDTPRLP